MMSELFAAGTTALWLGILTSISPCPLATNVAAVSFISRESVSPRRVFLSGLLYTLGRMTSYAVLGVLLVNSIAAAFETAGTLQRIMNPVLGGFLLISGLILLRILPIPAFTTGAGDAVARRLANHGLWGAFLLGALFALSFCPVSAALFFGSLLPVAVKTGSGIMVPWLYGMGTALPVLVFAVLLGIGLNKVAQAFDKLTAIEKWARLATGLVFVCLGMYYLYAYVIQPWIRSGA